MRLWERGLGFDLEAILEIQDIIDRHLLADRCDRNTQGLNANVKSERTTCVAIPVSHMKAVGFRASDHSYNGRYAAGAFPACGTEVYT